MGMGPPGEYAEKSAVMTGAGNFWNYDTYHSGSISSVWLKPYDDILQGAVTLFETADCHRM